MAYRHRGIELKDPSQLAYSGFAIRGNLAARGTTRIF